MLDAVTLVATGTVRSNFANHHFGFAVDHARRAHDIETANVGSGWGPHAVDVQREVIATLFFAVASLEAWINEVAANPKENFVDQDARLIAIAFDLAERKTIKEKLDLLAELKSAASPDCGARPGQDVLVLVDVRNSLTHYRPEFAPGAKHGQIAKKLEGRIKRTPFLDASEPLFPRAFASYDCARWAVESVRDFLDVFATPNGWHHPTKKDSKREAFKLPT